MNTVLGLNFFVFCLIVLIMVMYFSHDLRMEAFQQEEIRQEAFGTSAGTLTQLAASRTPQVIDVNARPNQAVEDAIQQQLTAKAVQSMTAPGDILDTTYAAA